MIDPLAVVDERAEVAADARIGPWTRIEGEVQIGAGTVIDSHVVVRGPTRIGRGNHIHPFCSIGDDPQDKKFDGSGESRLEIGDGNTIREYCSINRGTPGGGGLTRIGSDNWVMAYAHIAHDCHIGNHTVFANNASLAGHVEVEDHAILGGFVGVHQFCRVGAYSFLAAGSIVLKDVPPYLMVAGNSARARGLNREGLRRHGFATAEVEALRRAYRMLFRERRTLEQALAELEPLAASSPHVQRLVAFIRASRRGIVR